MYNNLIACITAPPPPDKMRQVEALIQQSGITFFSNSVIIVCPNVQTFAKLIRLREFLPKALKKDIQNITISVTGTNKRSSFRVHKIRRSCDYSN